MPLLKQKLNKLQVEDLKKFIQDKKRSGRETCRAQAVILLNDDVSQETIESLTGFKRRQPFRLRDKYLKLGTDSLRDRKKGKPKELLVRKQLKEIIKTVKTKRPKDPNILCQQYWNKNPPTWADLCYLIVDESSNQP